MRLLWGREMNEPGMQSIVSLRTKFVTRSRKEGTMKNGLVSSLCLIFIPLVMSSASARDYEMQPANLGERIETVFTCAGYDDRESKEVTFKMNEIPAGHIDNQYPYESGHTLRIQGTGIASVLGLSNYDYNRSGQGCWQNPERIYCNGTDPLRPGQFELSINRRTGQARGYLLIGKNSDRYEFSNFLNCDLAF